MKTIKKGDEIKRTFDNMADELVKKGWVYCPKSEWKAINRTQPTVPIDANGNEISAENMPKLTPKQKRKNKKLVDKVVETEQKKGKNKE